LPLTPNSSTGGGGGGGGDLKSIALITVGTRGDIQPLFAVALALRARGYAVRVVTSTAYVADMQDQGLEAIGLYDDLHQIIRSHPRLLQNFNAGNAFATMSPKIVPKLLQEVETNRPDLVITTHVGEYVGWAGAKLFGIPYVSVALYSLSYNPNYMQFGFPKLPFGLHYYILRDGILSVFYYVFLPVDKYLGINLMSTTVHRRQFTNSVLQPVRPIIHLMSPLFRAVLSPNSPAQHLWAGNTVVDPRFLLHNNNSSGFGGDGDDMAALEMFIKAGSKPIYVGWGSLIVKSPQWMTVFAVRVAQSANQRAIVVGGGAGLDGRLLVTGGLDGDNNNNNDDDEEMEKLRQYARDNVLFVPAAPHEWLFPRVACTVHHGGAGTTIAALRAGVPTIITPIFLDQYDNSYFVRTTNVGVGFPRRLADTTWQEVGEAVRQVLTDETIQQNVKDMSKKLLQEDGAIQAVLMIEQFWKEWGATGKFFAHFPDPAGPSNYLSVYLWMVLVGIVTVGWYYRYCYCTTSENSSSCRKKCTRTDGTDSTDGTAVDNDDDDVHCSDSAETIVMVLRSPKDPSPFDK
jgi:sterol 3beta-glucosyltransferase